MSNARMGLVMSPYKAIKFAPCGRRTFALFMAAL